MKFVRGRPVQFRIGDLTVGSVADQTEAFHLWEHVFGERPPQTRPEIEIDRTLDPGEAVVVSKYTLRGVDHYYLRPAEKDLKAHYDAQNLPQFLFLGAGLMIAGLALVAKR